MAVRDLEPPAPAVRRLWPADGDAVLDYFRRLDPETRANRFMGNVSDAGVRAYAARALRAEGVVYGAFLDGVLRGLGELRPAQAGALGYFLGASAEAAFAVERGHRRRGLGAALFARIARAARNRGVRDLRVRCLSRNGPMLRLAARHGADLRRDGMETEGALRLARPTPFSLWHESIAEAYDYTLCVTHPAASHVPALPAPAQRARPA